MRSEGSEGSVPFWLRSASFGGVTGMVGAIAISGLSAFAMRRLGVEMQWLQVAASGAAGGVVGTLLLRASMAAIQRMGYGVKALDRFVAYILVGFLASLILGGVVLAIQFKGQQGAIGPGLFTVIGWMVGLLAASLPLAIGELNSSESV